MSFTLVDKPLKVIQQDIPNNSKWSAVWHPIIFKFQRQDFVLTGIGDGGTSPQSVMIIALGDFTAELTIGQTIFVNADNGREYGNKTIINFSYDLGADETTIWYDGVIGSVPAANGFANLTTARSYYMIEVAIYHYKGGVATLLSSDNAQYRPDKTGVIKADLRAFLQTIIDNHDAFDYIQRTAAMPDSGCRYDIQVREYWKESGYTSYSSGGDLSNWNYINAVKQVGDLFGQNMGQYVMFPPDAFYEHSKGKFLTMFDTPTYFVGFPYELSFIYDKSITDASKLLSIVETRKDINRNTVDASDDLIDDDNSFVVAATLKAIFDNTPYAVNVKKLDVYLKSVVHSAGTDPNPVVFQFTNFTGSTDIQIVDVTLGKTIGYSQWSTNINNTMDNVQHSINVNASNGTPFNGSYPFDNSFGFTASYNAGTKELTVSPPSGFGSDYNGHNIAMYTDGGTFTGLVGNGNPIAGGIDGAIVDSEGLTTARVSEIKTIDIDNTCYDNPVLLRWLNPLGRYDFWLFHRNQVINSNISNEQIYERYTENLEDSTERAQVLSKDSQDEIDIAAELLDVSKMKGIRYLMSSIRVDMYVPNVLNDSAVNFKWVSVRIKPASFELYETNETKTRIELTIIPPQIYNQQS